MTRLRTLAAVGAVVAATLLAAPPAAAAPGPSGAPEYYFDDWNLYDLWDAGARGQGVTIAEIDTGVNADLAELRGRVVRGTDLGRRGDGRVDREVSAFGHGTAMASIMVARPGLLGITGIAPDARILPIAVPLNGTTDAAKPDRLADAIRYGADHDAKVISMSLGGKRSEGSDTESCPDEEQAAVFHALSKGAVVLASVGNSGPKRNAIEEPGVCLGVVSVGAVDAAGDVADFSSRQPYLTLVAPGVRIPSLGRVAATAYSGDGTSQATAVASAVAALVWSRHPTLTARAIVTRLLATLDTRGVRGHSEEYGYGRLDARRAVTADVPADAANPVYDSATPFVRRAAALDHPASVRPPVPVTGAPGSGRAEVGSVSRVDREVVLGAVAAAVGLVALLVLAVLGRRRRTRPAAAPAAGPRPWPAPSATDWSD
ncbi:Subtilase family protein [Jatrophihabitans endophyticus]|uniref:Subtilase family protein n=1 Tax=Jatrophihabitans endophyticus TaxID=1206085 RepID=A0A1M5H5N4_9ACTN|nr:S8 family serine peptidase [Jatrophihabitans endophyticus]SHG11320.1 Subtilase family protein [Jatrophihabitans endophyticus]